MGGCLSQCLADIDDDTGQDQGFERALQRSIAKSQQYIRQTEAQLQPTPPKPPLTAAAPPRQLAAGAARKGRQPRQQAQPPGSSLSPPARVRLVSRSSDDRPAPASTAPRRATRSWSDSRPGGPKQQPTRRPAATSLSPPGAGKTPYTTVNAQARSKERPHTRKNSVEDSQYPMLSVQQLNLPIQIHSYSNAMLATAAFGSSVTGSYESETVVISTLPVKASSNTSSVALNGSPSPPHLDAPVSAASQRSTTDPIRRLPDTVRISPSMLRRRLSDAELRTLSPPPMHAAAARTGELRRFAMWRCHAHKASIIQAGQRAVESGMQPQRSLSADDELQLPHAMPATTTVADTFTPLHADALRRGHRRSYSDDAYKDAPMPYVASSSPLSTSFQRAATPPFSMVMHPHYIAYSAADEEIATVMQRRQQLTSSAPSSSSISTITESLEAASNPSSSWKASPSMTADLPVAG